MELYKQCLAIRESSVIRGNRTGTTKIYHNIGWLYYKEENFDKAFDFLNNCHLVRESTFEPNYPKLVQTYDNIAFVLDDLHRNDEASSYRGLREKIQNYNKKK